MTEGQEANKEGDDHTFNGAVATLERIHVLIQFISIYRVNEHILGYKMNLYELLVEVQGFLTKDELKHAWAWWQEIDQYTIVKDEENDMIQGFGATSTTFLHGLGFAVIFIKLPLQIRPCKR
jgi:hypothetical protein